ncbi:unnamed protein product [Rotaria magnacalcarata]|uniref:Uncharacterized protein n=1 Tax=Rotaria magnacalcarata TaxID=392030 RepID=A0A816SY99_9BILA|nr:unnamed protein product [Rotaria magnacalcarata]CAF1675427.1 unnamed protein product [Rotaria magnacalcarata]CAF2092679.1 unnamed protein product [Rotaria magnacalcarata]
MSDNGQVNDAGRSVSCMFCNEKSVSTEEMRIHLLACGNKTDRCPNCKKFIRRAVFAYHYENGCANLDEIDNVRDRAAGTYVVPSAQQATSREVNITRMDVELPIQPNRESNTNQRSNSGIKTTMLCEFCDGECEPAQIEVHRKFCLQNPNRTVNRTTTLTGGSSNQHSDRLQREHPSSDAALIPCEYCQKPIEWRLFEDHTKYCDVRAQEQRQQQSRFVHVQQADNNRAIQCKHCNQERGAPSIEFHERVCQKYDSNTYSTVYTSAYTLSMFPY